MAKAQKNASVRLEFILFGLIAKQALMGKYALSHVHDLVDVIPHLKFKYSFLKKIKYEVNMNTLLAERNQSLFSRDKIVIQPKKPSARI